MAGRPVLLNPAVVPQRDAGAYLGEQPLWHGGGSIVVEAASSGRAARDRRRVDHAARTLLSAGRHRRREVLDYREMLAHYPGARTTLIEGSDHAISEFAQYVDEVLAFCDAEDVEPPAPRRRPEPNGRNKPQTDANQGMSGQLARPLPVTRFNPPARAYRAADPLPRTRCRAAHAATDR